MILPINPPKGFTEDYNPDLWNAGHVFQWSKLYEAWLDCEHRITVKPNQTIAEAYETNAGEPLSDKKVFFSLNF